MSRALPVLGLLIAALLVGVAPLVANPGALIVDLDRSRDVGGPRAGNDLTGLFLPRDLFVSAHLRRFGRPPEWDPRGFAGRPFVGNPQAGLFYPPAWVAWIVGSPAATGWLTVAHLLAAGIGTATLCGTLGLGRLAAATAGVAFMLNPYVLAQFAEGHLPHVWASCWFPWALLGALELSRGRWRRGSAGLAASLGLSLLAGHPQEGLYLGVAVGAWAVVDVGRIARSDGWRPATGRGLSWALAFGMATGLAAVEWLPDLLARPWSVVAHRSGTGPYHLGLANLPQLIWPWALGGPGEAFGAVNGWETLLAVGTVPMVLIVVGCLGRSSGRAVRGFFALFVLAGLHAAGDGLGLSAMVAAVVPGLGGLRVPARSLFLLAVAGAVLAGYGVEALRGRGKAALALLAMIELSLLSAFSLPTATAKAVLEQDAVAEAIAAVRPQGPVRVRARDAFYMDLHALRDGVEKTNIDDLFQIRHAAELCRELYPICGAGGPACGGRLDRRAADAVLDRLGVGLLIHDGNGPTGPWPVVASGARDGTPFQIRRNPGALPKAYVVPRAAVVDGEATLGALLRSDPREQVLMAVDPLRDRPGRRQAFTAASYESDDPDRVDVRVTTEAPGFLVVLDTWMPGWSATVDGRPATVLRGDHAFRVVALPAPGRHRVVFRYRAPGLRAGAVISLATLLGLVGLVASSRHRRRADRSTLSGRGTIC